MDIGERIFRAWLNHQKRREEKRHAADSVESPTVYLKERKPWLTSLGILLAGDLREIKGGSLYDPYPPPFYSFPDKLSLLPRAADNEELLAFRLMYLVETEQQGLYAPPTICSLREQLIFAVLTEAYLTAALARRYPGFQERKEKLYRAVLRTRPNVAVLRNVEDCIELAIQQSLGQTIQQRPAQRAKLGEFLNLLTAGNVNRENLGVLFARLSENAQKLSPKPHKQKLAPVVLWGLLSEETRQNEVTDRVPDGKTKTQHNHVVELDRTIRLQKPSEDKKPDNPLFHAFETTESLEDYQGESTQGQPTDDLAKDEEGLPDLFLGHVVRTFDETPGLVRADIADEPAGLQVASDATPTEQAHYYDEWDFRKNSYREHWCRVFERPLLGSQVADNDAKINQLLTQAKPQIIEVRGELLRLLSTRMLRNRQLDGPEIDIDAMVERHADLTAGNSPPERLYLSERLVMKDIAVLLLVDTSLSTDSWVQGRRVLDIEIESILILAKAFEGLFDDEVAVAHFNSRTRNECHFSVLKDFTDPWSRAIESCSSVEPFGYTRMGPAIRHAVKKLETQKAKKKFLLIVSDGKPTDYDQYEGRYGVRDVAQAVREAKQSGITTFGLTVEHQPKHYLAEMFGTGRYHVLPKSDLLPAYMANIFMEVLV